MILAVRTDAPEAVVKLFDGDRLVADYAWHVHRTLARDLLKVIHEQLAQHDIDWDGISGIILFKGPGSFTGLRIGAAALNTLAHVNRLPIVGVSGEAWAEDGLQRLRDGEDDRLILPDYGADAHITQPKK